MNTKRKVKDSDFKNKLDRKQSNKKIRQESAKDIDFVVASVKGAQNG